MIFAFVGKGGVGKTTVSSAVALALSEIGKPVLVSSDFMPSLHHIFPIDIPDMKVIELRGREIAEAWKSRYGRDVKLILNEFVDVDDWILDHVAYSPGVAEEFLISNIAEIEQSGKYDYVVWDTAASSSTMHLLFLEREFYGHLDTDVRIYLRLRDRFRSQKILKLLEEWKDLANRVWEQMMKTRFFVVTTSDELSLLQTDEIVADLKSMGFEGIESICNRCDRPSRPGFSFIIPELKGTSRGIVEDVRAIISSNLKVLVPTAGVPLK